MGSCDNAGDGDEYEIMKCVLELVHVTCNSPMWTAIKHAAIARIYLRIESSVFLIVVSPALWICSFLSLLSEAL